MCFSCGVKALLIQSPSIINHQSSSPPLAFRSGSPKFLFISKLIIPEFIEFISPCSSYALSIVLISVADGRWEDMRKFDDKIPKREFDNFQFLNFTEIMKRDHQTTELSFLGKTTGVAKKINLRPPPTPYTPTIRTELPSPAPDEHTQNNLLTFAFFSFFCRLVEIVDPGYQTVPSAEY
ncbi:unnamed protein product [Brassica napus]|uniref:(rape) hypothetical protein n=1 Tax=Brassica napus TaxID=3708 RepID=A0A816IJG6_BRANA|nr:unnamed protein product [Brassica napus]